MFYINKVIHNYTCYIYYINKYIKIYIYTWFKWEFNSISVPQNLLISQKTL